MKESKGDGVSTESLVLDIENFKGDFSYDTLFANLVNGLLPSFIEEEADSMEGMINISTTDTLSSGRSAKGLLSPLFPEVDTLLLIFKDLHTISSTSETGRYSRLASIILLTFMHRTSLLLSLIPCVFKIDGKLQKLKKDVVSQDSKHRKTLGELEKGVDGIFSSFARLDSRISSVGQTAAKIGDHLLSADSQRETASQDMELIKHLMEFNSSPSDLIQLPSLFSDDKRVAEAASIAQKLRSLAEEDIGRHGATMQSIPGNASASKGLEVAITNLQEYYNELENKLLFRFDFTSQRRELSNMAECAKILSRFNRGTSAMQHYVGLRPMFDVEVMNEDSRLVLGDEDSTPNHVDVNLALSERYRQIIDTVRKESAAIRTVFPCPNDVMSILVQRVMEDRIPNLLEKVLVKPSLVNPPPTKQGGLLLYLRRLAVGYERTQELAKDLCSVGCGDLDVDGLTEALFLEHKGSAVNQRSFNICYSGNIICELERRSNFKMQIVFTSEFNMPANLATNAKAVFTCLLDQVRQYTTKGLERARDGLREAASQRERFVLGRKVASGTASAAEGAAAAGQSNLRSFMLALQGCGSSVAVIQQYFAKSISRLLLPVDGAHAASCEEMTATMSNAESYACKGLQQCIEIVIAEVERLLSTEQKATDFKSPDDGLMADPRPTTACTRVVAYLSRVLESAFTALEGLNKQSFLSELGNRLHKTLTNHWLKFAFNASGGLKLKRDITEYGDFLRNFNTPAIDEKFETLSMFVQLRDDYRSARLASKLSSVWA
ncbi:hypothetical protein L1987_03374 [Smallanthus sonchifolius]|uniref:Uncharacterized protein n=1 Tax=Smallanthus sonchifolius TaxID=185202 RepID=A0ACB9KAL8_9ASTR|nr:hypothetical protein L1987_03374 [Smallanthus sonchifolius]